MKVILKIIIFTLVVKYLDAEAIYTLISQDGKEFRQLDENTRNLLPT